ncbi:MAG: VanZ family protein [Tuberibacillus sp.]
MSKKWLDWLLVWIWCAVIFLCTSSPLFTGDNTAAWIKEILAKFHYDSGHDINGGPFSWNFVIRKLAHLTEFGLLAFLLWRALRPVQRTGLWAWLLTVLYAATDEWHQSFQPGRSPEVTDVMIDACGAFIVLFVILPLVRRAVKA